MIDGESSGCPPLTMLRRIGDDDLPNDRFAAIESHVESCANCQSVMQKLADADRIVLGDDSRGNRFDGEPECDRAIVPDIPGFRIVDELGRGGEGVVFLAEETETQRLVALKFVPGGWLTGPKGRSRWIRQVRATAKVRHDNVVRLYRIDETSQWYLMVLEYIAGGTLRDRVQGPVDPHSAATLIRTLALAVEEIHRAGFLHLDLKPSNILMDGPPGAALSECVPKVSDFGISMIHGSGIGEALTELSGRGTPAFMAPEQAQAQSESLGPATDVYGLGGLLFFLLTAKPPFQAENIAQLLDYVRFAEPAFPADVSAAIDNELREICLKAMHKEPSRRFGTPGELGDALDTWLGAGVRQRRTAAGFESERGRRNRFAIAVSGVLSAVAIAAPFYLRPFVASSFVSSDGALSSAADWIQELGQTEPNVFFGPRLETLIASSRMHTSAMLSDASVDRERLIRMGVLIRALAVRFSMSNNRDLYEPSGALLECSLRLLQRSHDREPNDEEAIRELAITELAFASQKANDLEDDVATSRARHMAKQARISNSVAWIAQLSDSRARLHLYAQILDKCRGEIQDAEWKGLSGLGALWLETHDHCLKAMGDDADEPKIAIRAAAVRRDMRLFRNGPIRMDADELLILQREWVMYGFADLICGLAGQGKVADDEDAEAAFAEASRTLQSFGLGDERLPMIIYEDLIRPVASISTWNRARERRSQAEAIERTYEKLCRVVLERFPDRFESWLGLSEAYLQSWKNELRRGDVIAAEASLRKSLETARKASDLAPGHWRPREMLEDREKRLARFRSTLADSPTDR